MAGRRREHPPAIILIIQFDGGLVTGMNRESSSGVAQAMIRLFEQKERSRGCNLRLPGLRPPTNAARTQ